MRGRVGRPGLMGLAARTAVVAGTASAVGNRVNRRAMGRAEQEAQAEAYQQQQAAMAQQAAIQQAMAAQQAAPPPPPPPAPAAPAASSTDDMIAALERLAALHAQGILSDEELAQQKAKILGG